ncbi:MULTISPECIES: cytochrome P450 [unclassified Streptomyces]|uniref:cytochrome P450 n=1 Tax=unclassified Streptomyces TaxID=2593676 RepID=UPI001907A08C|nr:MULTISPECIES: cytochrome P450 [unclassified Streptomyces]MCU4746079.1 cytochrome P450 [Streptomyces sp. G-5]QQN76408.1 cytochrome P450 [Streptomyces sp. XC 2026]
MEPQPRYDSPPPGCPAHQGGATEEQYEYESVPLYGEEFAADPQSFYTYLRQFGPAAPVELSPGVEATLVTDYAAALHVLQNPERFSKDARRWADLKEGRIAEDSPVLPMLGYRPNALFTDGAEHMRLRQAITDSLARIDAHRLSRHVERVSTYLVSQFSHRGTVDLLTEYARMLPLLVFNELFGCSPEIGDRLIYGTSGIFDGGVDADSANKELSAALQELIAAKRANPGEDVVSWLMEHPSQLSDEEMIHQLVMLISAGMEPQRNLIANGLQLILSDDRYSGGQFGGALLVEDALDAVLWDAPPMANYAPHYPVQDTDLMGVPVEAGELLLISFAAANSDPALPSARHTLSKRAHLAWSAGPHACPAKDPAQLIAVSAIEKLLNQLPDIELAVPEESLVWRPGPFQRGLTSLPARFAPVRPTRPQASSGGAGAGANGGSNVPTSKPGKGSVWSSFLAWWRV